jgi:hypothetical protein
MIEAVGVADQRIGEAAQIKAMHKRPFVEASEI